MIKWKKNNQKYLRRKSGITLVALVITIIVLLILAGVALSTLTGNDSIIQNAGTVVGDYNSQQEVDEAVLNSIAGYLEQHMTNGGNNPPSTGGEAPLITTASGIHSETTEYQDAKGNKIVVPGGFKVRTDIATTVDKGIVIEDSTGDSNSTGNQFVWVPIGTITKSDDTEVTIEFGRYSDFSLTASPAQYATNNRWNAATPINAELGNFSELTTYRGSNYAKDMENSNATARSLQSFIENAIANEGYYIARYEASFGSGDVVWLSNGRAGVTNQKPQFKQSTDISDGGMNFSEGTLWRLIRQGDASLACQNLYAGNEYNGKSYVESDLVNSYAWDTAIMFIQKCSDKTTYWDDTDNGLYNTGEDEGKTIDNPCNIYDMKGNLAEWTTEYSYYSGGYYSCVFRGNYPGYGYTAMRFSVDATSCDEYVGFRAVLSCSPVS